MEQYLIDEIKVLVGDGSKGVHELVHALASKFDLFGAISGASFAGLTIEGYIVTEGFITKAPVEVAVVEGV